MRTTAESLAPRARRSKRPHRAFTLVETLIVLVLMALLLSAVGAATHGVLTSYVENAKIAEVTQAARVILQRMMKEVRTADAVTATAHHVLIVPPDNPEQVTQIEYELDGGTFFRRQTVAGVVEPVALVTSGEDLQVLEFAVSRVTAMDGAVEYTVSLTARLSLKIGSNPFIVTASVCPRRNLTF